MPRPTNYVTRNDLGWRPTGASSANPRGGLVVHYDSIDQNLAGKPHTACIAYWHNTRKFHTGPSRGWADIGYSWMACAHGYVLEGRGLFRVQAAQPGGNSSHYSVTLATGPKDRVTPEQINAVRQLRAWLMEPESSISGKVLGHRDFIPTSCPGDRAYAMVRDGTFAKPATWGPGTVAPSPTHPDEEFIDVAKQRSFKKDTNPQVIPEGAWTNVQFDKGEYSLAFEGETYVIGAGITFAFEAPEGVEVSGREVQVRLAEYRPNPKAGQKGEPNHIRHRGLHISSPVQDGGMLHTTIAWPGTVPKDRRIRVEAIHYIKGATVRVADASASVLYSK